MWANICKGEKKNVGNNYLDIKVKLIGSMKNINICKILL